MRSAIGAIPRQELRLPVVDYALPAIPSPNDWQEHPTLQAIAKSSELQATASPAQPKSPTASPDSSPQPEAAATESKSSGWVVWLIALLAISSVAAFVFTLLNRPLSPQTISLPLSEDDPLTEHPDPMMEAAEAAAPVHKNGTSPAKAKAKITSSKLATTKVSKPPGADVNSLSNTTRLPRVDAVDGLLRDLHIPDPVKRRKAIWELGQVGDSRAVQPLTDLMIDSDSSQRSLILASISEIGIRTLKPINRALLLSLQDSNSDVRKNAIRDVTRIYEMMTQISQLLAHASSDPDEEVRDTARWALTQLNRMRNLPELDKFVGLSGVDKTLDHLL